MRRVRVLILRVAGTNCDYETKFAFEHVGAYVDLVHINRLFKKEKRLTDYQILAIPGGFTYGDDVSAGKILANELKYRLGDALKDFISQGKLIIGICNGFQVLVKAGLLSGAGAEEGEATLVLNDSGKFEDRWVYLKQPMGAGQGRENKCVWTQGIDEIIYLPVAHAEGKFVPANEAALAKLKENKRIVFQYVNKEGSLAGYPDNPNGSMDNIAGICNRTGRILGMMPHPERYIDPLNHPRWTREDLKKEGEGVKIFRNGVEYAKANL